MTSAFLKDLKDRGVIFQTTERVEDLFNTQKVTAYQGFDATSDSLHIGNLVGIMILRRLEKAGHQPIVLLGGATTLVGDPSDKDKERPLLDEETIRKNMDSLKKVFNVYLENPIIVNNADWLKPMGYIEFLRDVGRYFSVNRMLSFEFVKNRLNNNKSFSFLEMNYMLIQGYDFYHLFKEYHCHLQIGGSEQWGNIINGVELIHKTLGKEAHALTVPLITTASGGKMGKTAEGKAIWLNADKTNAYDFWQYFRNVDDRDVKKFFLIFTELSVDEIETVTRSDINEAKKRLADEVTALLHGPHSLSTIHQTVAALFENKSGNIDSLPVIVIDSTDLQLIDALVRGKVYSSRSEAKKGVLSGAIKIDEAKIIDPLTPIAWRQNQILTVGKKHHYRIDLSHESI